MPRLSSRALKCTLVLDPNEITDIGDVSTPRVVLNIQVADLGTITADIAAKSVRKAQAQIAEHGADGVAVILQGKLASSSRILEVGLVAQIRQPRAVAAEVAA